MHLPQTPVAQNGRENPSSKIYESMSRADCLPRNSEEGRMTLPDRWRWHFEISSCSLRGVFDKFFQPGVPIFQMGRALRDLGSVPARRVMRCCESVSAVGSREVADTAGEKQVEKQTEKQTEKQAEGRKKAAVENLWREFFADPSQWWDYRSSKASARYPDFKHKKATAALWLDGKSNPPWVAAELAALPPGAVQSDIFTWNARLARLVEARQYEAALHLFQQMRREGMLLDRSAALRVLKACAGMRALDEGRLVHEQIVRMGSERDAYAGTSLIDMYAKCGSLDDARRVFDEMPTRGVVAWNAMIQGYVKAGQAEKALLLFGQMEREGVEQDAVTFAGALNACAALGALAKGRSLQEKITWSGGESDVFVGNCLVDMYAKCGSLAEARRAFDGMANRNVVSWNAMIQGYARGGQGVEALRLFELMRERGVPPVPATFAGALQACASSGNLNEGRRIHDRIIESGCEHDASLGACLVYMYTQCGTLEDAQRVFQGMPIRNVAAWNAMILGFGKCGEWEKALELFRQMQREGVKADAVTFVGVLVSCAGAGALEEGTRIHGQIVRYGLESEQFICHSLVDMYVKCGSLSDARKVFNKMPSRSVATWNAMIMGIVDSGQHKKAYELSRQMRKESLEPNVLTFVAILKACGGAGALEVGKRVHEEMVDRACESDIILSNSLINMYAKCGSTMDARKVFKKMPLRNVISWNAMLFAYANCGVGERALDLCRQMEREGVKPDRVTFVGMLSACARVKSLEEGRRVHELMIQAGCESEACVGSGLVDMYAKCGSIEDAWKVFEERPVKSIVTWNAMISGCAKCGEGRKALELFLQMQQEGLKPDPVTFVGVITACGRERALEQGELLHHQIVREGYRSDIFVNNALIDMYARCGSIENARSTFDGMPRRNVYSWNTMIMAYAQCGREQEALQLSEQIQREGDPESYFGMLDVSAGDEALGEAWSVLDQMIQSDCEFDILRDVGVLEFYGKLSSIEDARRVFSDAISSRPLSNFSR